MGVAYFGPIFGLASIICYENPFNPSMLSHLRGLYILLTGRACSIKFVYSGFDWISQTKIIADNNCNISSVFSGAPTRASPHTHKIWSTSFRLVVTWLTERTYASTDCTGGVGETIKREGGVFLACLGKSTSLIKDIHNMVNWQLSKQDSH